MSYSDWNQYGVSATDHYLDENIAYEGSAALRTDTAQFGPEILAQSEADAPAEARVQTYTDCDYASTAITCFFRFQDVNNFYAASFYCDDDGTYSDVRWHVIKVVGGTIHNVGSHQVVSSGNFNDVHLSDGTDMDSGWNPLRITCWEDDADTLRFRIEDEADGDGSWTKIDSDIVDRAPDLATGGGVGVGENTKGMDPQGGFLAYDLTEVYY